MTENRAEQYQAELSNLMDHIAGGFARTQGRHTAEQYILGLMSSAERKNGWQLAEQLGDSTPYKIQQFLYRGAWNADEVRDALQDYVAEHIGEPNGVLVVDETGFLKQGRKSAGVKRQYSDTAGRIENCQIGVFLSYAGSKGHTLVDRELYLPKEWIEERERCQGAGIPDEIEFRTKPQMAEQMIAAAHDRGLSFQWVTGDSVYGDVWGLRHYLEEIGKHYVLSVSGKTSVWIGFESRRVSQILATLPEEGWQRLSCGDGSKGEKAYDWFYQPINGSDEENEKGLLVRRSLSHPDKLRAYLCYSPKSAPISELVRIAGVRWTVEMCFAESKGEVGLDHYEVRNYSGWYRHITLSMCALALLTVLKAAEQEIAISEMIPSATADSLQAFKKGRGLS